MYTTHLGNQVTGRNVPGPLALAIFAAQVEILWTAGLALALGTVTGGWLGAHMTISHGETWIRRVLYIALVLMIFKLLFF